MSKPELEEALRVAVSALRWYAKASNWGPDDWGVTAVAKPPEYGKAGQKARNALEKIGRMGCH